MLVAHGSPESLYAGTDGAVFTSTDRGQTWHLRSVGGGSGWVSTLAVDPHDSRTVFAASASGLFHSGDGGAHWKRIQTDARNSVEALAIDPQHPSTIYVSACKNRLGCGAHATFLETVDGGAARDALRAT